jgi:hypothetical protein
VAGAGFQGERNCRVESAVLSAPSILGAAMLADLDVLLIAVFCAAGDLLLAVV